MQQDSVYGYIIPAPDYLKQTPLACDFIAERGWVYMILDSGKSSLGRLDSEVS